MCTGIRLIAEDGAPIYARTLEFGQPIQSQMIIIPRGYQFTGTTPHESAGLRWQSRYAATGTNALGLHHLLDGINERGLAGGLFYFPHFAHYQNSSPDNFSKTLAPWELLTWILTTVATIAELEEQLPTIIVANTVYKPWDMVPPLHLIVHDESGQSLVIEYRDGRLFMHHNPLGVLTNSPDFRWQLLNLNNYVHLSPVNRKSMNLHGISLIPFGQGSGMLGLPGDFTPPSRFVRAVALSQTAFVGRNAEQTRISAFKVLNLFNIPKGVIQDVQGDTLTYDYTQWTSACDLQNRVYYYHTYENQEIKSVHLDQFNLTMPEPRLMPL